MTKNLKKIDSWKKFIDFGSKIAIYLSLDLHKERPSTSKLEISSLLWTFFAFFDQNESGSGSTTLEATIWSASHYLQDCNKRLAILLVNEQFTYPWTSVKDVQALQNLKFLHFCGSLCHSGSGSGDPADQNESGNNLVRFPLFTGLYTNAWPSYL
jgi:hypothetical protein